MKNTTKRVCTPACQSCARELFALCLLCLGLAAHPTQGSDATYVYTVQLSAAVQENPPAITLNWPQDPFGALLYTVYRKASQDTSWGNPLATLSGDTTSFTDNNVTVGSAWEYQVIKNSKVGYIGYGYIYAGIKAPLIETRGTLILVMEQTAAAALGPELARLQSDLVGDGWQVVPLTISSNALPQTLHDQIAAIYSNDPAHVNAVFLFGHVPILLSGELNYDGHQVRPMPADAFYADMNNDWPTDPALSPSFLPSDVELMIGRVDLWNMPGQGSASPWPSEIELLRNYLNKDHNWRHKQFTVPRRALVGNLRGDEGGEAPAASGFRNFATFVGPANTFESNVNYDAPVNELWISLLGSGGYLWTYACGAGLAYGVSGMGTNTYNFVLSTDIVAVDTHAVFYMMFGSWFGDWTCPDDLLRSVLATPTMGLTACVAGVPQWYLHHMALGQPIGYSTRLTMNNSTLYKNDTNAFARAVYVSLMGDPTLRMDQVAPPGIPGAIVSNGSVSLTWSASPDATAGYHVYRSISPSGPFTRLTQSLVTAPSYLDPAPPAGNITYMVRAISLEQHFSGSYYNPSQGVFVTVGTSAVQVQATWTSGGFRLIWNSAQGATYRVLAGSDLLNIANWPPVSPVISGNGSQVSWTDTTAQSTGSKFYRVLQQ